MPLSEEEELEYLRLKKRAAESAAPAEQRLDTVLPDWMAEFAGGANRAMARTGDFFITNPINTIGSMGSYGVFPTLERMFGAEPGSIRVPTFENTLERATGGTHGFMEPGIARDFVQASGEWAPSFASLGISAVNPPQLARTTGSATDLLQESAPSIDELGARASAQYNKLKGIDDAIPQDKLDEFASGLRQRLIDSGLKVDSKTSRGRAPISYSVYRDAVDDFASAGDDVADDLMPDWLKPYASTPASAPKRVTVSDIEQVRQQAQDAVMSQNRPDVRFGNVIKSYIDDWFDAYPEAQDAVQKARLLSQQASKARRIEQMIELSHTYRSGTENGLRSQANNLLKEIIRGKTKGWTAEEVAAIRRVANGSAGEKALRLIGGFGMVDEMGGMRRVVPMMGSAAAGTVGGAVAGPVGAGVAAGGTLLIGQAARNMATKLMERNAQLASAIVRAGPNARAIAASYMKNVPEGMRSAEELASLFYTNRVPIVQLAHIGEAGAFSPLVVAAANAALNVKENVEPDDPEQIVAGGLQ